MGWLNMLEIETKYILEFSPSKFFKWYKPLIFYTKTIRLDLNELRLKLR